MLLAIGFHLRRDESAVAAGIPRLARSLCRVWTFFALEVSRARNAALAGMLKTVAEALKNSTSNHPVKRAHKLPIHAVEGAGSPAPSKCASISSRVSPFVSGRNTAAVMT